MEQPKVYQVKILKGIWNVEESELNGHMRGIDGGGVIPSGTAYFYELEIPFVPFIGLEIWHEGWVSGKLKEVVWRGADSMFVCRTDEEFPGQYGDDYLSEEDLQEMAVSDGWKQVMVAK